MRQWLFELDRILRGQATSLPSLRDGRLDVRIGGLVVTLVILGLIYGFCMGWFALVNRPGGQPEPMQVLASMVKVPLLFLLTLVVTFPSLYVFNALVGSRLSLGSVLRLLLVAITVTLAVLASFAPITVFFSVTTSSYPFMVLLNVLLFTVAGVLGLAFLLQTLHRMTVAMGLEEPGEIAPSTPPPPDVPAPMPGALDEIEGHVLGPHVGAVFRIWVIVFAVVGAQMSWVLRPFIGHPDKPFTWFRPRESNFFEAVWRTIQQLLS